jgi:hypothetical protein
MLIISTCYFHLLYFGVVINYIHLLLNHNPSPFLSLSFSYSTTLTMTTVNKTPHPLDGSGDITKFQQYVDKLLKIVPDLKSVKSIEIGPVIEYSRMVDHYSKAANKNPNITIEDVMWRATLTNGSVVVRCTSSEIAANKRWLVGISQYVVGSDGHDVVLTTSERGHKTSAMKNIPSFAFRRASPSTVLENYETINCDELEPNVMSIASWKRFYKACPRDVLESIEYFLLFCDRAYPKYSIRDDGGSNDNTDDCNPFENIDEGLDRSSELPVVPRSQREQFGNMRNIIRNAVRNM